MKKYTIDVFYSSTAEATSAAIEAGVKEAVDEGASNTKKSALKTYMENRSKLAQKTGIKVLGSLSGVALASLGSGDGSNVYETGVVANGKLFVVRGGLELKPDGRHRQSPLRFERYDTDSKKAMSLDTCTWDSDCFNDGCGRLSRGGGDDELVCCGDTQRYAGYDYCTGTVGINETCWFHDQCMSSGFCDGTCKEPKKVGETCSKDIECGGSNFFCDEGKCKQKKDNEEPCDGWNKYCKSNACGLTEQGSSERICCPSGRTNKFLTKHYCEGFILDGQSCIGDWHCQSGFCNDEGVCHRKMRNGEECDEMDDNQCLSGKCGREEALSDKYVCCRDDTVQFELLDFCNQLPDGKTCYRDTMCAGGFCAGNAIALGRPGICATKGSVKDGEECFATDDLCKSGLSCGLEETGSDTYICCDSVSRYFGYDYCTNLKDGMKCKVDSHCASGECAGNSLGRTGECVTP